MGSRGSYMWSDAHTYYPDPSWQAADLRNVEMAWYQRTVILPDEWVGRRVSVSIHQLNSYAIAYLDGERLGEIAFPGGDMLIADALESGGVRTLSLFVAALPLRAELADYSNSAEERRRQGTVDLRGLCGDVSLVGEPNAARVGEVLVRTSIRRGEVAFDTVLNNLDTNTTYRLKARVSDGGTVVKEFVGEVFRATDVDKVDSPSPDRGRRKSSGTSIRRRTCTRSKSPCSTATAKRSTSTIQRALGSASFGSTGKISD